MNVIIFLIIFIVSWFIHIITCFISSYLEYSFFCICYHNNIKIDNNSWTVSSHEFNLPLFGGLTSTSVVWTGVFVVRVVWTGVFVVGVVWTGVFVVGVVWTGVFVVGVEWIGVFVVGVVWTGVFVVGVEWIGVFVVGVVWTGVLW